MPDRRATRWREDLPARVAAAAGSVLLLALGWKLASGLVPGGVPAPGPGERLRVTFSSRPASPARPVPPAVATARAGAPPAPRDVSAMPPSSRAMPPAGAARGVRPVLFGEDGRPRLPADPADRWDPPPRPVPGAVAAPAGADAAARRLQRPDPVDPRTTRFADDWASDGDVADVVNRKIARAQRRIAEFLLGADIEHARARPSPPVRFDPARHEDAADLGSEASGDAYKAAPLDYQPAPGLEGEASRRIREQVAALETAYARCDRERLRRLMQPLLVHLDELQKAEAALARGADPVRARHMLPNVADNAYDMARRALWYADARMAGCAPAGD